MVTRKQYTKEFKLDAMSLVLDQDHTTSEVSRNLEITLNMLRRWIREYQEGDAHQSFRGNGKLTPEQEEIRQLKAQIKQLKLERDIAKSSNYSYGSRRIGKALNALGYPVGRRKLGV